MTAEPADTDSQPETAASLYEQFARLGRQLRTLTLPPGLTPERLSALSVIEKHGPIGVTALADKEMVSPATTSRMVAALVEQGLVKRNHDKCDGRGVLVSTTPRGKRVYQHAHEQRLRRFADALASLDKDQLAAVRDLLTALLDQAARN